MPIKLHKVLSVLLILLLVVDSTSQQCSLGSSSDLLQSGSVSISNSHSNASSSNPSFREHIYSLAINYAVPASGFQVAASSSLFAVSSNGLDFSIKGKQATSTSAIIILLLNEDLSWSTVKVHYLISSRSDFNLGFFVVDTYILSKSSSSFSVTYDIHDWTNSQLSYSAVTQLSGIKTLSPTYNLAFTSLSIASSTGTLTLGVSFTGNYVPLQTLYITYIVYQLNSPITYSSYNIQNPSSAAYTFIGIQQLSTGVAVASGSAFNSVSPIGMICVGSGCPSSCISSQTCSNYGGLTYNGICNICGSGQTFSNGACQSSINCGANQYFSGTSCICNSGYFMVSNICYQICKVNGYLSGNTCICQPGYQFNPSTGLCSSSTYKICAADEVLVGYNCICLNGKGKIGGVCTVCPPNSNVGMVGDCICNTGRTLASITDTCDSTCVANSYKDASGQCVCYNGYYVQGNQCVPNLNCQGGMMWTTGGCVCPNGQYIDFITNTCVYCNTADRQVSGLSCVCGSAYYPTSTGCSPCGPNSYYDSSSRACICNSGSSYINGQCVPSNPYQCPSSQQWSSVLQKCVCTNSTLVLINGLCQNCPVNSQSTGSTCVCNQGYNLVGGSCVPGCTKAYSQWSSQDQACVCIANYTINLMMSGACVPCPVNSTYDAAKRTCKCNPGYWGTSLVCSNCDVNCKTCNAYGSSACTSCTLPKILSGSVCAQVACMSGYFMNSNGGCTPCSANCIVCSNDQFCTTCATGFNTSLEIVNHTTVTVCRSSSAPHRILTLKGNVIGNYVVYQGVALSSMPSALLANGCQSCNDLLYVKYNSTYQVTVNIYSEYVANSQYWFVVYFDFTKSGYFPSFNFTISINSYFQQYFTVPEMFQSLSGSVTTPMPLMYSTQASSTAASALLTATAPLTVTPLTKAQKDSMFL